MVIIDAFDDEYGLQNWAEYYASHGFIAMTIGNFYNDYWWYISVFHWKKNFKVCK